jgi:L-arabinose isomerase
MTQNTARIGLLGLFFDLYLSMGDSLLKTQEAFAQRLVACLQEMNDVVFPGVCTNREEVDRAVDLMDREGVDLIVVVFLTYAPSLYVLPALQRTLRPVLIFNTQKLYAVTEKLQPTDTSENHGMHGVQDLANTLLRAGRPFHIVTGFWEDTDVLAEVQAWCDAARVCRELSQAQVGLLGHPMESMGDFGLDETACLAQIGVHVHHLPMRLVADRAVNAPVAEIEAQMVFDREHFQVDPNLTPEQHEAGSRLEWALRKVLEERGLLGFASHFLAVGNEGVLDTLPFLAACKLLGEGYGYGAEGDVTSAIATWLLRRLTGEATFTEMFTMDFGGGTVLMSHMGEGNWRMAHDQYPVVLGSGPFRMVALHVAPVSLGFTYRPGPVTLVSITTVDKGRLRFIITEGEIIDTPPIPAISRVHCRFRPNQPLPQFLTHYSEAGGSHHQGMAYGHVAAKVVRLARLLGVDYEII